MKKIISYSLWGDKPMYTMGAIENAIQAKEIYPDWVCRFYIGKSVPDEIVKQLQSMDNTECVLMDEWGDWTAMFWRFYPASDDDVNVCVIRDCDSRLSIREKMAVDEWLKSDKGVHIMRDHPHHTAPIMGGMWGVKIGVLKNMVSMIKNYFKGDFWQVDQNFLGECVYPLIKGDSMVHDEFFEKKPFPMRRDGNKFVGEKIYIYENR